MKAPPLGLAWIGAVLEQAGHEVRIIDTPTLGMRLGEWLNEVKQWRPDIVGFSLLTPLAPKGYKAIRFLRMEFGNEIPVIVGGPHPTFMYDEALENGADIVVRGEGEYTTLELINTIEKYGVDKGKLREVKGIAFKDNERTIVTPPRPFINNLDELPWPARHLLPMEKYTMFHKPIKVAHIMASRGCPYGCMYCSTSYFWGRRIRFRRAKNVVDEIEYLVDKYHTKYIAFTDDELTVGKRFVLEFIDEIKKRGLDIEFACGSRVDHVDKEYMKLLYDNGCVTLYFGVESANQFTLDRIGKKITLERIRKVFRWKKELGGFALGSFILGFPWETIDDMKRTVQFAIELEPDYAQFTALTPYPGTPMYEYAKRYDLIEDYDWEHYTTIRAVVKGFYFTREQLGRMIKYAYRKFFLRPGFIRREFKAGRLKDIVGILLKEGASYLIDMTMHSIK